ncbi:endoglucanase [Clostridium tetanomorphum]|uniref:M42 family metallopeptidase n=1 Tax=Clostridium tetanomorphum TaxID=1553 RepID=A0A923EDM0_CLOTT|nr:M42 family metallopeptidase [Clostridium tetanomorphum]KAJ49470.1 Endoglucanase, aminopeptidase M42 family protein [Clostridium tetanomorphum DSM 665]KAJ53043.1 Endoglucanase, aminopeptidase M42 family protein [Clostridium tetanomorphum DSM 665]MBC2400176.1 M42 family metallopeptidase [Clostridium tetanomorphum]MBP1866572.1 endoglucanase [Clostridium tetanomorphum]NRS86685.1 endoglucanase [Clostridium tetanomorphum]
MECKEILKNLCQVHSPSGREEWIYNIIKSNFQCFGEVSKDNLNNIYIHKKANNKGNNKGKLMIMAHADEVFLMITEFHENGFLKFKSQGIDAKALVSQEVLIHGRKPINGVIGIKPPHLIEINESEKSISIDDLLIDTGYSIEELKEIVNVGDYATLKRSFYELLNNNVVCKAIDDRAGIAALYECAKEIKNIKNNMDIYFVCSCQEEVGHRGAKVASYNINPDIGIAIDVTFDSGKLGDTNRENVLAGGPIICIGPNIHAKLREKIMEIANEYNIPYGVEVEPGNTGTDAWDIQISRDGIPTLLISIPIKYMHTSVEMVNIEDIKNTGRLLAKFIEKLNDIELEDILCF